jgi:hypothetical protein
MLLQIERKDLVDLSDLKFLFEHLLIILPKK